MLESEGRVPLSVRNGEAVATFRGIEIAAWGFNTGRSHLAFDAKKPLEIYPRLMKPMGRLFLGMIPKSTQSTHVATVTLPPSGPKKIAQLPTSVIFDVNNA